MPSRTRVLINPNIDRPEFRGTVEREDEPRRVAWVGVEESYVRFQVPTAIASGIFPGLRYSPSVPPMTPSSLVPRRILLVDDDPIVCDSIRRLLQFDGHSVEIAASGEEALTLLQKSTFDLVVTDYEMPPMNGDNLAAAIKAILPKQPVLMVTAYGEQLRSADKPLAAVDAMIGKPFQMEELRQAITSLMVNTPGPSVQPG